LKKHLEEQQRLEQVRESTIEATRRKREEDRRRREEEVEEERRRKAVEQQEIEASRQRIQEEVRLRNEGMSKAQVSPSDDENEGGGRTKPRRKRQPTRGGGEDDDDAADEMGDEATPVKPRKAPRKLIRKRAGPTDPAETDPPAEEEVNEYAGSGNKQYKSKAYVDSEDDL
ncbi:hypothetical protein BJ085DRAFT_36052, partial [Dimargaris cristalligena]